MSLRHAAQYLAAHGRGGDSTLVHMSPREVHSLQQLAKSKGGSLTVNPHTGLVEAKFFEELKKVAEKTAPYVAAYYLGPEVAGTFGISEAAGAGIAAGGTSFAMTGSLQKGLQTGLTAYGLTGLGQAAMGGVDSANSTLAKEVAEKLPASEIENQSAAEINRLAAREVAARQMSIGDTIKAGARGIGSLGAKDLFKFGSAAAGPLLASMASEKNKNLNNVPSSSTPTGYIRQYYFDPKTQSVKPLAPVRTQDFGDTTFESRVPYIPKSAGGGLQSSYATGGVTDGGMAGGGGIGGLDYQTLVSSLQNSPLTAAQRANPNSQYQATVDYTSPTVSDDMVQKAYQAVWGRAAVPWEVEAWQGVAGDATEKALSKAPIQTQVSDMYRNVLGRDADPGGLAT